jgi:hypothetical protein
VWDKPLRKSALGMPCSAIAWYLHTDESSYSHVHAIGMNLAFRKVQSEGTMLYRCSCRGSGTLRPGTSKRRNRWARAGSAGRRLIAAVKPQYRDSRSIRHRPPLEPTQQLKAIVATGHEYHH